MAFFNPLLICLNYLRKIKNWARALSTDRVTLAQSDKKTYFDVYGSPLICAIEDDSGNVIASVDVSKAFVVNSVEGNGTVFTNSKNIVFPASESKFSEVNSAVFLGVKKDGTPFVIKGSVNMDE